MLNQTLDCRLLAAHVLAALAASPSSSMFHAGDLADKLGARRTDVRRVLSALHREGMVDLLHRRVTLSGLAVGRSLAGSMLKPFRVADAVPAPARACA